MSFKDYSNEIILIVDLMGVIFLAFLFIFGYGSLIFLFIFLIMHIIMKYVNGNMLNKVIKAWKGEK